MPTVVISHRKQESESENLSMHIDVAYFEELKDQNVYTGTDQQYDVDMHQNQSPWILMVSVLISIGFDCIGFVVVLRYCGH